jgi:hypothetical protein
MVMARADAFVHHGSLANKEGARRMTGAPGWQVTK